MAATGMECLLLVVWINLRLQTERNGLTRIRLRTRWCPMVMPCDCNAAHSLRLP